jgi:hypothetical protein
MTNACPHEANVRQAAAGDRWTEALRAHAKECADCAAAAAVSAFMNVAASSTVRPSLPDPAVIWLKANLMRGLAITDRASRPLNFVQLIAYLAVAAGWAALLTWKWADLHAWVVSVTPANLVGNLAGTEASFSVTIVAAVVILSSLTLGLGLHAILAEE